MRTSSQANFLKSLPIVAGCLGEKLGVTIKFGDVACTDGECITLPTFMDERAITREEMLGFVVHEASHIRYTQMDIFSRRTNLTPIQHSFINAIEDARIEKLIGGVYAGARHLLSRAHEPCFTAFLKPETKLNPQSALSLYLLAECQSSYVRDKLLLEVRDALKARCIRHFGAPLMADIDAELAAFPALQSTDDAANLADRIFRLLLDRLPAENVRQRSGGGSGEDGTEGEKGEAGEEQEAGQTTQDGPSGAANGNSREPGTPRNDGAEDAQSAESSQGSSPSSKSSEGSKSADDSALSDSKENAGGEEGGSSNSSNSANSPSSGSETGSNSEGCSGSDSSDAASESSSGSASSSPSSASDSADASNGYGSSGSSDSEGDSGSGEAGSDEGADSASDSAASGSGLSKGQALAVRRVLEAKEKTIQSADLSRIGRRLTRAAEGTQPTEWGPTTISAPAKSSSFDRGGADRSQERELGAERLKKARAESVKARRALTGIVEAKTRCGAYTANSGRRLQAAGLSRLAAGSTHVFERREVALGVDTAVAILLDLSGSVGYGEDAAIRASLALKVALESIPKVSSCLTVFPAQTSVRLESFEPCMQVVPFGVRSERCVEDIGALFSNGGTPLAPTLLKTAVELSGRKEAKKVVIVITDGEIDDEASAVLKRFDKSDIILAGIGIGIIRESRRRFEEDFKINVILHDFDRLQEVLMDLARRIMVENLH